MENITGEAFAAAAHPHDEVETWAEFVLRHTGLVVCLVFELTLVLALYLYHVWWNRKQMRRSRQSAIINDSTAYAKGMLQHLVPWLFVERHRFHGMCCKAEPMSIQFEGIGLALSDGQQVLHDVSGEFHAGTMNAIMGPSGAGKTTCMNVICGKAASGKVAGSVRINGKDRDSSAFASVVGYVPQDDVVHEGLTVSEQIQFSAYLRGPRHRTRLQSKQITEDVLNIMQLSSCRDAIVGNVESRGVSGGQRKRVNIGLELAADPTILFLDEPTSGLDATAALTIVHGLKTLTKLGTTVMMVIHQPRYDVFTLFEDVLLLGRGGWLAYFGPAVTAKTYFERQGFQMPPNENPADWLMDVISGEVSNGQIRKFETKTLSNLWRASDWDEEETSSERLESKPDNRTSSSTELGEDVSTAEMFVQAWKSIEPSETGALREPGLHQLLARCAGVEPKAEVVSALLKRMARPGEDSITRQDFLDYMMGLQSVLGGKVLASVGLDTACGAHTQSCQDWGAHFKICLHRCLIQWWRNNKKRRVFLGVYIVAGVFMACMDEFVSKVPKWDPAPFVNLHSSVALLTCIFSQSAFGTGRTFFWRERVRHLNVCSYFLATVIVTFVDIMLQVYTYSAVYYLIRRPRLDFVDFWGAFLLVAYVSSGMGYVMASVLPLQQGPFVAVLLSFISCGMLGYPVKVAKLTTGGFSEVILDLTSITRWSAGMSFLMNLDAYRSQGIPLQESEKLWMLEHLYREKPMWQDKLGYAGAGITCLMAMGTVLHVAAYLGFRFANKRKQL